MIVKVEKIEVLMKRGGCFGGVVCWDFIEFVLLKMWYCDFDLIYEMVFGVVCFMVF